ncbi:hypothetical protein [Streptomyces sp. NPDC054765]
MPKATASHIAGVFREEYGRAVAVLVRVFGDIARTENTAERHFLQRRRHTLPRGGGGRR